MKRRDFINLLGGAAAAWPLAVRAQQLAIPVVGSLYTVSAAEYADRIAAVRRGLGEMGFVEGRNVTIEYRWADGRFDKLPEMAADLVGRKVAVILTNADASAAVLAATRTIPIVFTTASDPVARGLVASLNRPGGNVTGATSFGVELIPKQLELLHELLPTATRIALLVNPNGREGASTQTQRAEEAARRLGLEIIVVSARTDNEMDLAFATAVQQRAAALIFGGDAFINSRYEQTAALTLRHALPTMIGSHEAVTAGALISYADVQGDTFRQAGVYIGRILKGEKPGDLPVLQPTKFELVINLKTAKAIGLTITESFLARADEVIE